MSYTRAFLARAIKSAMALTLYLAADSGFAQDVDAAKIRGEASREPVSVLQNRHFLKAWRPEVGFLVGSMLNQAYTETQVYGLRAGVFWSEWMGFEFQSLRTQVSDTADRTALNTLKYRPVDATGENADTIVSPDPEINSIHSMNDLNVIAAPFYGKMNLLDRYIVYSDLYISVGLARVDSDQKTHSAFSWGAGQRFYFSESWSVRIDFKDRIFEEQRAGKKSTRNAYSVDFGASYLFF